jgi:hypothetical protein
MKHRAHQVYAYVPRKPRRDRLAYAARLVILCALLAFSLILLVTR